VTNNNTIINRQQNNEGEDAKEGRVYCFFSFFFLVLFCDGFFF
jgi:hypothetical protein